MTERNIGPGAGPGTRASLRGKAPLRSDAWLRGDDEVAMAHRVAFRSSGLEVSREGGRPVIGIANSASELNPCNLPLRALAEAVRRGVVQAGGGPGGVRVEPPGGGAGEAPGRATRWARHPPSPCWPRRSA